MATNDKTTSAVPQPKPPEVKASLSDVNARDSFIAAALKEIVSWQLAESKVDHAQAGTYAVRYANAAMATRASETTPLNVVVAKGVKTEAAPPVPPPPIIETGQRDDPPKSIAEIIGDAPELAEVK
jgi:hypothetical protein